MARYIQKIKLLGKEKWIGWEVDGVGTDLPGMLLADELGAEELALRGIREFQPLPFEQFIALTTVTTQANADLLDQDLQFRLDALQVGMERYRCSGLTDVPRAKVAVVFGDERKLEDPRVQARFREWQSLGAVQMIGAEDCYLRITGRLA